MNKISDQRSRNMSAIKSKNTKPEIAVRKMLHALGYRFRLHRKDLPGSPDIVLPKYKTVIFVHGCFWHRHENCKFASTPKTRKEFWENKFNENMKRDKNNFKELKKLNWNLLVIWECETKNINLLIKKVSQKIGNIQLSNSNPGPRSIEKSSGSQSGAAYFTDNFK